MKKVYLVRHGESEANVGVDFHIDDREYALTERGIQQSRFIAKRAAELSFDVLLSSPYVRTRDTAALIAAETGHTPEYSELFIERVPPSDVTGKSTDDPEANEVFRQWVDTFYTEGRKVSDGENFADITQRAKRALEYLFERPEETFLVTTHGYFLRVILGVVIFGDSLTPQALRHLVAATQTTNTGITLLAYGERVHEHDVDPQRPRWRIRVYNDHAHLG